MPYHSHHHAHRLHLRHAQSYQRQKFAKVMREFYHGTLHSGSKHGPQVTNVDQAKAIAASESGTTRSRTRSRGLRR